MRIGRTYGCKQVCPARSCSLQDRQTPYPIDQVDESAIVLKDVVAGDTGIWRGRIRNEKRGLLWRQRIGDVDDPYALGKPGNRDLGTTHDFDRLMTAGHHWMPAPMK